MLAVATVDPDAVAETYVRQHIFGIAPGNTSVIYFSGEGRSIEGLPSLKLNRERRKTYSVSRLSSVWRALVQGYSGSLSAAEEKLVREFFLRHGVTALLAEFGPTGCIFRNVCRKTGVRLVTNFHGYDATVMSKRWFVRRAYRKLNRDGDAIVCGSNYFVSVLRKIGFSKEKISVVPCGIELASIPDSAKKDPNLVVAVGRLTQKKAPHLTIEAFGRVKERLPAARLEIVGEGVMREHCELAIKRLGLEGSVVMHGSADHAFVIGLLSRASVFMQHSVTGPNGDTESQGIALMEAMANVVPVVVTRHNGFPEYVADHRDGYLVEEGDVIGMADKVSVLLENPELRQRMGLEGRSKVVGKYSIQQLNDQMAVIMQIERQ